ADFGSGKPGSGRGWQYPARPGSGSAARKRIRTNMNHQPMTRTSYRTAWLIALIAFTATGIVSAQNNGNGQRITPRFKDAEIGQVIEAVASATGKTIIPDPRVRAPVTMLSSTPMTPDAFYEAFLALLQVHQFVALESGGIVKIVPDANARQMPNIDLPD